MARSFHHLSSTDVVRFHTLWYSRLRQQVYWTSDCPAESYTLAPAACSESAAAVVVAVVVVVVVVVVPL